MKNIEKVKECIKHGQSTQFNISATRYFLEAISLLLLELVERKGQQ